MKAHAHRIFWLLGLLLSVTLSVAGQEMHRILHLEVMNNGQQLENPWAGGFNNPQFSEADINNDGIPDLVVFDRSDNHFLTFINGGQAGELDYQYAPEYEANFPDLRSWSLLLDYNCDGIADLFTGFNDGIKVFEGSFDASNKITFQESANKLTYDNDFDDIEVAQYDIPAIVDVNYDGHLDILTFDPSGGYIFFFENEAANCGELNFVLASECWGYVYETGTKQALQLDEDCGAGKTEEEQGHPGSTLLSIDLNNDNLNELILGDINFDNLVALMNDGSPSDAHIFDQDTTFPAYNLPVDLLSFPATFAADVDNDGLKDILVAPNSVALLEPYRCSHWYKNVGSEEEALFEFQQDLFLLDGMIEYGRGAHPALFDYNADGLTDLLIGNGFSFEFGENKIASLSLYENVGTDVHPVFELVDNDFLNFSQQGFLELVPTFGDLNGDGAVDMMLGTAGPTVPVPGGDFNGVLIYFENQAEMGQEVDYSAFPAFKFQDIDVGQRSAPQLVDVDGDNLLDLLIGESLGVIEYWKNTGDEQNPQLELINNFWGEVDVRDTEIGDGFGHSVPQLVRFEEGDDWTLLVGSINGQIYQYGDIEANLESGTFTVVAEAFNGIRDGYDSSPVLGDLNGDGGLEMLIGCRRGGVSLYSTEPDIYTSFDEINPLESAIKIYPNPASEEIIINCSSELSETIPLSIEILSLDGKLIHQTEMTNNTNTISLDNVAAGVYFIRFSEGAYTTTQKLVVVR